MRRIFKSVLILSVSLTLCFAGFSQTSEWKRVPGKIASPWAEKVDPSNPLPEYPRPQMVRGNWVNLNGLWNYSIQPKSANKPAGYAGKILVPFAVESSLSGVGKTVGKDSLLWYNRKFSVSNRMKKGKKILLHFGAVDWRATVYVNNQEVGMHEGGYVPFTYDITRFLTSGEQDLTISVWDPTDEGPQARGKQVKNPRGIMYTAVTGIWQTVWIEAVPETYISSIAPTPDIDKKSLSVKVNVTDAKAGDMVRITASSDNNKVAEVEVKAGEEGVLNIPEPKLWSPETPFLYDLQVTVRRKNKDVDQVDSYFGMRKSSMAPDKNGIQRMLLNNEFVFQYGPLDQGWWPDGLYTAPTDEALLFDIVKTKEMGFNMIRKHVKVEPARWYYYCDSVGMLVWQDMPSGDMGNQWNQKPGYYGLGTDKDRTPESEKYFREEWNAIIESFYHFPSINVWTPFNEAWGQFKTEEIVNWTMKKDPTRLVNTASGGNFVDVGHIIDIHNYPAPAMPHPKLFGKERALVLGEFGGLGLPVPGNVWQEKDNWGYQSFKTPEELLKKYDEFIGKIPDMISAGLSAAVYTQTTDVEVEVNGLMTYDRKVIKIPESKLKSIHAKLYDSKLGQMK